MTLRDKINDKFGSITAFASVLKVAQSTVSLWCQGQAVSRRHRMLVLISLELTEQELLGLQQKSLKETFDG